VGQAAIGGRTIRVSAQAVAGTDLAGPSADRRRYLADCRRMQSAAQVHLFQAGLCALPVAWDRATVPELEAQVVLAVWVDPVGSADRVE